MMKEQRSLGLRRKTQRSERNSEAEQHKAARQSVEYGL